ncbi:MAG: hypothetical protein ACI8W8_002138 [Rhodothermales bacterium]|jgi:hypothetical protein
MSARLKSVVFLIAITILSLSITSCKLIEMLTDHEKEVESKLNKMKVNITHKKWKDIFAATTKDFAFYHVNGKKYSRAMDKGRVVNYGHRIFRSRILELPDAWVDFRMKPTKMTKINDERFLAEVEMRLRIRIHASDIDNIVWMTRQSWVKETTRGKAGGEKFVWKLKEYHELTQKVGSRGRVFAPGPPLPPRPKYYSDGTETEAATPSKKMEKKARSLTNNRDAALDRNN